MPIPASYRQIKTAQIEAATPTMAKHPKILKDFVEAVLQDEWNKPRQCNGITTEIVDGFVVITFNMVNASAIMVKIAITELQDLHSQIGDILGQ
jgi:hypothetical protein